MCSALTARLSFPHKVVPDVFNETNFESGQFGQPLSDDPTKL